LLKGDFFFEGSLDGAGAGGLGAPDPPVVCGVGASSSFFLLPKGLPPAPPPSLSPAGGGLTYDDIQVFYGAQDRFTFKLIGKKELYMPYNSYAHAFGDPEKVFMSHHMNPDVERFELHRVWVVEGTLKPQFRHIYSKRVFYFDEDAYGYGLGDEYDMNGKLWRLTHNTGFQLYDGSKYAYQLIFGVNDLLSGVYSYSSQPTNTGKIIPKPDLYKDKGKYFSAQAIQANCVR